MDNTKVKVVVTGFSCRMPESGTPDEFWQHLIKGKDLVTTHRERWSSEQYELPPRYGKVPDLSQFDALHFEVHAKQAHKMDPQLRLLLEVSYEAILNSGYNPSDLRGSNAGVFVGACLSDTFSNYSDTPALMTGYENSGCSLSMFSNRISFYFDLHGPSETIDTACSSSLVAMDAAVNAIRSGRCDYAIVGGTNLLLRPGVSVGFDKLNMLSPDGACKSFDKDGNGYARSEAVVAVVLSKDSLARRSMATILGTGVNSDGYTEQGITYPNSHAQHRLLQMVYQQHAIDPAEVCYVEAHGTGTQAGDSQEVNAIDEFFCSQRSESTPPLLIGAVKSNMGHAEGASGLAGMVKVLLSMQNGAIPANLHFNEPNPDIPGLHTGRMKVVTELTPWQGGIVGLSSFGFGGTNAHIVLQGGLKYSNSTGDAEIDNNPAMPGILPCSAKTEPGLQALLDHFESHAPDIETLSLLRNIANKPAKHFPYRACLVTKSDGQTTRLVTTNTPPTPPVWFVFPGMGAQWQGMGKGLMSLPVFKRTIEQCHAALQDADADLDLIRLISQGESADYDNITNAFVGLTAIQLGLVDILRSLGIKAAGFIGHSVGETACAYADGSLNLQQAILAAFWRGKSVLGTNRRHGKMAAVEITWDEAQTLCKDGVVAACHNSEYSVTLSGDGPAIDQLITDLQARGIEAKEVNSAGIAFHAPNIQAAAAAFQTALSDVIRQPRQRSSRWISTSSHDVQDCSAEYFAANLTRPVLFHEAVKQIPPGAIVIEIGAHSLLRAALMETVEQCRYVGLMRRNFDNTDTLMEALAQAFGFGLNIQWDSLFPGTYPLRHAPRLPPLVDWDHSQQWQVSKPGLISSSDNPALEKIFAIDLSTPQYAYLEDHRVNGRIIFPATGYLWLVWNTLAQANHTTLEKFCIQFQDVSFHQATPLSHDEAVELMVRYLPTSRYFELLYNNDLIVSGKASVISDTDVNAALQRSTSGTSAPYSGDRLEKADVYKELRLRGYGYGPAFQRLVAANFDGTQATIDWDNNWVSCLDSLLHFSAVKYDRIPLVPTFIRNMLINPGLRPEGGHLEARHDPYLGQIRCDGVLIEGCKFSPMANRRHDELAQLQEMHFIPYFEDTCLATEDAQEVRHYIQLTEAYILNRFQSLMRSLDATQTPLPGHLQQTRAILMGISKPEPDAAEVDRFMQHPQAHLLRLAHHIYQAPEQLLEHSMPTIVGFEEYSQLYKHDLNMAYLLQPRYLGGLIDVVLENCAAQGNIRIGEAGAGTGGLAHHVLPKLRNTEDSYTLTDISAGFFETLKNQFSDYAPVIQCKTWNLNSTVTTEFNKSFDLLLASNVIHATQNLRQALTSVHAALDDDGFFLLHEFTAGYVSILGIWGFLDELWDFNDPQDRGHGACLSKIQWLALLKEQGFDVVACKDDQISHTLFLCRKTRQTAMTNTRIHFNGPAEESLDAIRAVLDNEDPDAGPAWVYGNEVEAPGLIGMVNCLRKEPGGERLRAVFVEGTELPDAAQWDKLYAAGLVNNVFRNGEWGSYRYRPLQPQLEYATADAYLAMDATGDLASLHWATAPPAEGGLYTSCYCALNFKDVMHATGKLAETGTNRLGTTFTWEFAGIGPDGKRVMGGMLNGSMFSRGRIKQSASGRLWEVPDDWSLQEAATVPVVYMTAYLALIVRAGLHKGQRILIHSGTGGVGQAAIRIAGALGCEVFTTVGSERKRRFIRETFPAIAEDHIGSSHDSSFEHMIMHATRGKGVDVVLNSLAGDQLKAGIRVLARYGHFVEIGRFDMMQNTDIGMEMFMKDISFHGIGLDNVMQDNPEEFARVVHGIKEGMASGVVKPLDSTVFASDQIQDAFRFMARGKHIGKVLIDFTRTAEDQSSAKKLIARKRFWCHPDKAYLITGGLGGFGMELTDWLVRHGARHITLTSRSGIKNQYQAYRIGKWQTQGVDITVSTLNVADQNDTTLLIEQIQQKTPLAGVFHLAMVLSDAMFVNQTMETFNSVCAVKLDAARNLDQVTKALCPALENFVMFSSVSGSYGNAGQANYGYANFALDRLCEQRRQQSYPALAVQWGAVGDVGFVHDNQDYVDLASMPIKKQSIRSCLESLGQLLLQVHPVVSSVMPSRAIQNSHQTDVSGTIDTVMDLETLIGKIKAILGYAADHAIPLDSPFAELGMDSLMAVEIRQVLEKNGNIKVKLPEVRKLSLSGISDLFNSTQVDKTAIPPAASSLSDDSTSTDAMIQAYGDSLTGSRVLYFANGVMNDSHEFLSGIDIPEDTSVFLIRYERADSMSELVRLWLQHIHALPAHVESVSAIGFSVGAMVIHRFTRLVSQAELGRKVVFTTISPVKDEVFSILNNVGRTELDTLSREQAMATMQNMPWYGNFPALSFEDTMKQFKFMVTDYFYQLELGMVDHIVLPVNDPLCWSSQEAGEYAANIISVEGAHDLRSIKFDEFI